MFLELRTEAQFREFFAEFGATEESVRRDVQCLIEWMEKQPHLPNLKDEQWVTNVLLRCKNSMERTKKRIDYYFTTKAMFPEIFQNRDMRAAMKELHMFVCLPLPKLTPDGHRVLITAIQEHNPNELPSGEAIIRGMQMVFDYCLKFDQVRGVTLIYDMKYTSIAFVSTLMQTLNKYVLVQNKVNPIRYNKVYLVNVPSIAQPFISLTCTIVKKETNKVVIWKKECTKLSEEISKECLPDEYGGTEGSLKELRDRFYEDVTNTLSSYLKEQEALLADLSKKLEHRASESSQYGLDGSFRKLCVD